MTVAETKAAEAFAQRWTWTPLVTLTAADVTWLQANGIQP